MKKLLNLLLLALTAQLLLAQADTLRQSDDRSLERGHLTNALEALQGRTAGVTVSQNVNSEAMLSSVRVRGNSSLVGGNEPLVIIDGMSSDLRTLSTIYPADIESFTILKDATQTAQYGSRGAAGVIQVRTKRGTDQRFYIGYNGDVGFSNAYKTLTMLSAPEYRQVTTDRHLSIVDKGYNNDFQQAILRTGFVQNHHIAFGGGNTHTQYRASISYSQNNSVVQTVGSRNFTTKLDVTQRALNDYLTIDFGMFASTQSNSYLANEQVIFYSAAAFNPTFPTGKDADGNYATYSDASQIGNPQQKLEVKNDKDGLHINSHLQLTANLGKGFSIGAFGSLGYDVDNAADFYPTYVENTGKIYRSTLKQLAWLTNLTANYELKQADHHLTLNLLAEMQGNRSNGFHTTVNQLTTNQFGYYNLAAGATRLWEGTGSTYLTTRMLSFMGRAEYSYARRYTLSFTARGDASSLMSRNHKWGFFPSVAATWTLNEEPWLKQAQWLSKLQVSAGYGMSGNLGGISAYYTMPLMGPVGIVDNNGTETVTLGLMRNNNTDLRWEKNQTWNISADFGIFSNRFLINLNWYHSYISDMLYNYTVPTPPFVYSTLLANLGKMENSGLEVGVGIVAVKKKDFDFNISFNIAWQRNRLTSLDGYYDGQYLTAPQYQPIAGLTGAGLHGGFTNVVYQIVGQPLGVFYLPHCEGLQTEEDGTKTYIVADLDNDQDTDISDAYDRQICGQATPKVLLGSNFSFRYKQFDLTLQVNGAFGHKIYNGTALSYMNMGSLPYYNVFKDAPAENISDMTVTDYWLERGDYINFDYLTIGYTYYRKRETTWLKSFRVSVSINNLGTITAYSGLSPMINNSVVDATLGVDDKRTFPVYRTYSLGFSVQF